MFIVNQDCTSSFNVEIIDQFAAVAPRADDADKRPLVIAIIGSREEIMGRFASLEDCKLIIEYLSFLINHRGTKICVPKPEAVAIIRRTQERVVNTGGKMPADIGVFIEKAIRDIFSDSKNQNPGGMSK